MAALTKAEMAERLYEELGLNKREAKEMVEAFFDEIRGALSHNEQVKLSGFYALTTPSHAYPHTAAFGYVQRLLEAFGAER